MKTKLISLAIILVCVPLFWAIGCRGIVDEKDYEVFARAIGDTTITVYPTVARIGRNFEYDTGASAAIAEMIRSEELATVTISHEQVSITRGWHANQARMLRESAEDFATHIAAHPVNTDYVLLAEYLGGRPNRFGGIHCYILEKTGTPVFVLLLNSHDKRFARKSPSSKADCTDVLLDTLRHDLSRADK